MAVNMSQSDDHTNKSLAPLHDTTSRRQMTPFPKRRRQSVREPCLMQLPSYHSMPSKARQTLRSSHGS